MKKFYLYLVAAVMMFGATACQKNAADEVAANEPMSFTASLNITRTELGEGNKVVWNADDKIRIYTQENAAGTVFESNVTETAATATFTTTEEFTASQNGYLAFYPEVNYDLSTWPAAEVAPEATCANGVWSVPVNIGVEQDVVPNTWDEKYNYMVAYSQNNQLAFQAATALIKFTYTGATPYAFFRAEGAQIAGDAILNYDTTTGTISYTTTQQGAEISLAGLEAGQTYYIPIYPGKVTSFSLEGYTAMYMPETYYAYEGEFEFKAGKIYTIKGGEAATPSPFTLMDGSGMLYKPMEIDANGYHVAKNTMWFENAFFYAYDMNEGEKILVASETVVTGQWQATTNMSMKGFDAPEGYMFDVYLSSDATMMCVVNAGESVPALPTQENDYVLLGVGQIRDDIVASVFNVQNITWNVEIYEHADHPGSIFLKNAYTSAYPYNEPGDYRTEDVYFEINIADPDQVVIPTQLMGFDWDPTQFGEMLVGTVQPGTLKDGIITFPTNGLAIGLMIYTEGQLAFYANSNDQFAVAMPGYEIPAPAEANFEAQLYYISEVAPSYSSTYPDHSSLAFYMAGADIVSGGYVMLEGSLGTYDPVSGDMVASVVESICANNKITEDEFFGSFSASMLTDINSSYYLGVYSGLTAETDYTFFAKATNSEGLTKYVAHTLPTKAQGGIVIPAVGTYVKKHSLKNQINVSDFNLMQEKIELVQIR